MAAFPGLYRMTIMFAIFTGARIGEIMAIRWSDVDLDRGVVKIQRTVSTARVKGEITQDGHRWFDLKTRKGIREIPIPSELVLALRAWKE